MTMGFLSPSPSLFATNHPFLPHHLCFRYFLSLSYWCGCMYVVKCMLLCVLNVSVLAIRNQTRATLDHKKCRIREKLQICGCDNSESATENGFSRRDLVLFSLSYSLSLVFPSLGTLSFHLTGSLFLILFKTGSVCYWPFCIRREILLNPRNLLCSLAGSHAEEELKMVSLVDDINAYSYLYPVELPSKKFLFKW